MADTMTVLFATDRPLVRAGLRAVLAEAPGLRLAGEATTGEETRRLCQAIQPTVVLLDPRLTDPPALETIAALRRDCPAARVVVLAPPGAIEAMRALVALGAAGAVSLDDTPATVVQAIQMVGQGGALSESAAAGRAGAGGGARRGAADHARARGAGLPGRWAAQRGDRRGALGVGAHGRVPRRPPARQAGRGDAHGSRSPGPGARAAGGRQHRR